MVGSDEVRIKGDPTKELFVHVLTRDTAFHAAIAELIDNSIDGAKRVAKDRDNLSGYEVDVHFDKDRMSIEDNCGGIPLDVARRYAFRFGRPEDAGSLPGSIGRFGIGMKRALLSFGRRFSVESATEEDWFRLEVDLNEWMKKEDWDFVLHGHGANDSTRKRGTRIEVTNLTKEASAQFALAAFRTRVETEVGQRHRFFIAKGLVVRVCGTTIPREEWQLFDDDRLKAAYREDTYEAEGRAPVRVRIYVGVGRSSPPDAGWYVICNGRLVLHADKSETTGWGWEEPDLSPGRIPRYHNQYARFRGFALFDSDDAERLPWNTAKTDVDADNPTWLNARDTMATMMRPVIEFLNLADKETELPENERPLTSALQSARIKPIAEVRNVRKFEFPPQGSSRPPTVSIQFRKEKDRVERLQAAMGTSSARETGDAAFEESYSNHVSHE